MKTYKVIGVSSGIGLSLFPFKEHVIGNVEDRAIFHTPKNEQWVSNFGNTPLRRDLTYFLLSKPDVLISSPDCGAGSVLRFSRAKKLGDNKENKSLALFFEAIHQLKPKFFLFENLDGLFKSFPESDFDELLKEYRLKKWVEPVSAWGNSQVNRKRLIVIGVRRELPRDVLKCFRLPKEEFNLKTCHDLYGDLFYEDPTIGHIREDIDSLITIYAGKKLTLKQIQEQWVTTFKKTSRWKVEDRKFTTAPGVYKNRKNAYPATARKANRQFDHRGLTLTPRQLARVQGAPDDFKLFIDEDRRQYWINKARAVVTKTPPMEISVWFKKCVEKALDKL